MEEIKKKNNLVTIIISAVLVLVAFVGGYFLSATLNNNEKTKCDAPIEDESKEKSKDEVKEETKKATSVMDNIVVNLYDGGYVYFISDSSLYYIEADLLEDNRWFLLTYAPCLRQDQGIDAEYCYGNPVYERKAVKVEGIENVDKVRLLHRPGATDESFETFAIDQTGNAYIINKITATKYYGNNDVEDLLDENTVVLKDGSTKTID